jgi:hypothetical protein
LRASWATGISSTESNVNKEQKKKEAKCLVNTNSQKVTFGHTASAIIIITIHGHRYELPD